MSNNEKQTNSNTAKAASSAPKYDDELEKTAFPLLLHEIISDPSTDYCIHWLSCGTRFMISDKKKFAKEVLPRFYGNAKFTSFTRRLKRWSFTRVPSGPFMGAYFNPNFRRGEPELAARVRYDHPTQLSGAAMQLNKAKLEALGGSGPTAYHPGQFEASATTSIQQQLGSIPNEDRAGLLMRQMGMLNGGTMGSSMQQSQGAQHNMQAIYRMMQQNAIAQQQQQGQATSTSDGGSSSNMASTNNTVALQMAMAQEMMQQRQQQQQISPHGQQQLAMLLQNQVAAAQQGMPNQVSLPSFASFQQGMGDGVGTGSGGSLSNNQTGPSAGSLTTLTGGGNPNMTANGTPQLNFNSPYGMLGGGGAQGNPAAMNAFLAQYAQQGGVVPAIPPPTKEAAAPTDGGGGDDKDGDASV